jgi:hypothetical protein
MGVPSPPSQNGDSVFGTTTPPEIQLIRAFILTRSAELLEACCSFMNDPMFGFEYDPSEDTMESELEEPKDEWIFDDSYGITCWSEDFDEAMINGMKTRIIEEIRPYVEVGTVHSVVWRDEAISYGLLLLSDAIKHEWFRVAGKMQHPAYWNRSEPDYADYWFEEFDLRDEWEPLIDWDEVPQHVKPYIRQVIQTAQGLINLWFEGENDSGEIPIDFSVPISITRNLFRMTCEAMDSRNEARLTHMMQDLYLIMSHFQCG